MKIMVINGPNINMIGIREKEVYGNKTFFEICKYIETEAKKMGHEIMLFQSNVEGEIINFLQKAYFENFDGVIINPGAYTHYSYAIYDAIKCNIDIPTVEVHISNIYSRENFRNISKTAKACIGQISGFGEYGYIMAIMALENYKKV